MRERSSGQSCGAGLLHRLSGRLPDGLRLLSSAATDHVSALYEVERACLERAVETRRHEFSTGRWLARRGLAELGIPARPILPGPAREPRWPPDVVASLTHSASVCAFVSGLARNYKGVGLDLELSEVIEPGLADLIVSPLEPPAYRSPALLRLVFSAKESVYKCLYPIHRTAFEFRDLEIRLDQSARTFRAVPAPGRGLARPDVLAAGTGVFELDERGAVTLFAIQARRLEPRA